MPQAPRPTYSTGELDTWLRCPARYSYETVDGLSAALPPSGPRPTYDDGEAALSTAWAAEGPVGHLHERHYRGVADRMVARLTEMVATEAGAVHHRRRWIIDVGTGKVVVRPHRVVEHPWGAVTVQIVGARRRDQPRVAGLVAALSIGARRTSPDARVTVELLDPDDGEVIEAEMVDDEAAIERYRDAIAEIERGSFAPRPDPRRCPACPFFIVCGA